MINGKSMNICVLRTPRLYLNSSRTCHANSYTDKSRTKTITTLERCNEKRSLVTTLQRSNPNELKIFFCHFVQLLGCKYLIFN